MTKEGIRYILEGQADSFRALSRRNTEIFVEVEDDFFKGKAEAYTLAAEAFENIIRNYLPKEVDDVGNEN
jgi:hypothetical protein